MVDAPAASADVARHEPYVGPLALSEEHIIYGRDRELRELYNLLITERITLLHSPSGAGKSSIIQAGLIPRLRGQPGRKPGTPQGAQAPPRPYFEVVPIARFGAGLPAEYSAVSHTANFFVLRLLVSLEQAPGQKPLAPAELAGLTLPQYVELRYGERQAPAGEEPETEQPRARTGRNAPAGVVWVFDQFEDVLTVEPFDVEARREFFEQLGFVLGSRKRWALFSMREDFLGQLEPYRDLVPGRLRATYRLAPLGPIAAAQSIREPARAAGVPFTEDAVNRLVKDLRTAVIQLPDGRMQSGPGPYIEPVQLQVVCRRIWNHLPAGTQQIGEEMIADGDYVGQALTEYYAESVGEVVSKCEVPERLIRDWFERLITPQNTRGQVPLELEGEQVLPLDAIEALVDRHLVRRDDRHGTTWFELAHDRMIQPVRQDNERWREEHLSTLQKRAQVWANTGRPEGLLLLGAELRDAERQEHEGQVELRKVEREFLRASTQAATARLRRLAVTFAIFAILFTALIVVVFFWNDAAIAKERAVAAEGTAVVAGETAVAERDRADHERETAVAERDRADDNAQLAEQERARADAEADLAISRALALGAVGRLNDRLDLSLLLSVEARTFMDTVEARSSLYSGLTTGAPLAARSPRLAGFLWGEPLVAYAVAFSPDGHTIASAGADGAIWLWDTLSHRLIWSLAGHDGQPVSGIAFSPDGSILASGGWDDKVRLWDLSSGRELIALEGHNKDVLAVAFAPDGKTLVSAGGEGTIRLWDPVARFSLGALPGGHEGVAMAVAFSPKGNASVVFSGGADGLVRRWDILTRQEILPPLSEAETPVRALTFSPQGDLLAVAGQDGRVFLWDVGINGTDVVTNSRVPKATLDTLNTLAFSSDGKTLFGAGSQKTIYAWDVERWNRDSQEVYTLTGHTGTVNALAVSADGLMLASAGQGSEAEGATPEKADVRLWDLGSNWPTTTTLAYSGSSVDSVSVTRDGRILASGGADGLIRLWDLPSGAPYGDPLLGHGAGVSELAFSPLDDTLASIGTNGELLLWSQPWQKPRVIEVGGVAQLPRNPRLAFSPDGRTLAVAAGTQIAVWDIISGTYNTLDAPIVISALRFSADGGVLAAGGCLDPQDNGCSHGVLRLWKMPDGQPMSSLPDSENTELSALAFSADGETLATGYTDSSIRLWKWPTLAPLGPRLQGHAAQVTGLAFSPDGRTLASTSKDGTVRLWPTRGGGSPNPPFWQQFQAENDVVFSPDRRLLAVAGDGTPGLRLLDADPDSWVRRACTIANRNLTALEWEQYLPIGMTRRATCSDLPLDGP